ncbi:hypothetical protein A200_04560 [Parascardovia denticolens IPLA 20019]|nr:hypothetical protein A200_04560 [Parascardovia denticolens IPLA 20019]
MAAVGLDAVLLILFGVIKTKRKKDTHGSRPAADSDGQTAYHLPSPMRSGGSVPRPLAAIVTAFTRFQPINRSWMCSPL